MANPSRGLSSHVLYRSMREVGREHRRFLLAVRAFDAGEGRARRTPGQVPQVPGGSPRPPRRRAGPRRDRPRRGRAGRRRRLHRSRRSRAGGSGFQTRGPLRCPVGEAGNADVVLSRAHNGPTRSGGEAEATIAGCACSGSQQAGRRSGRTQAADTGTARADFHKGVLDAGGCRPRRFGRRGPRQRGGTAGRSSATGRPDSAGVYLADRAGRVVAGIPTGHRPGVGGDGAAAAGLHRPDRSGRLRDLPSRGTRRGNPFLGSRKSQNSLVHTLHRAAAGRRDPAFLHAQAAVGPTRRASADPLADAAGGAAAVRLCGPRLPGGRCPAAQADRRRLPGQRLGQFPPGHAQLSGERPGFDDRHAAGGRAQRAAVCRSAGPRVWPFRPRGPGCG